MPELPLGLQIVVRALDVAVRVLNWRPREILIQQLTLLRYRISDRATPARSRYDRPPRDRYSRRRKTP